MQATVLPYPPARRRARSAFHSHLHFPCRCQRRIADLEKRADILLALLKACDQRRMAALEELEALKGGRP